MSSHSRARTLSVVAAGITAIALIATTITTASATPKPPIPTPSVTKLKLPDGKAASRVLPGRYLVETVATPLSRGGSRLTNEGAARTASAAARAAGAKIGTTYSELWSGVSVSATAAQIAVLAQSPAVKAVYPVLRVDLPKTTRSTRASGALDQLSELGVGQDGTGIRVGVLDTGIDSDNPDLGGTGTHMFPTQRIAFGRDFVGDDFDSYNFDDEDSSTWPVEDADPDDCEGHGTHVAGIIGASGTGEDESTRGVAAGVTFGAYRIFGCEGSTDTEVILKALQRAKSDGMNVVNLSIGSDFDNWPSYPDAVAVANLAKAGVVVAVAAGNSGDTGLFSAGSPAVGAGVISVASYEGESLRVRAIEVAGTKYVYNEVYGVAVAPGDGSQPTLQLASSATGCTADGGVATLVTGTVVLLKKGSCTVNEAMANAANAGAGGVLLYQAAAGMEWYSAVEYYDDTFFTIPAVSIEGTAGANLAAALGTGGREMTWLDYQRGLANPVGGTVSTFSSAGLAADLSLVPTISAPGSKIYSTLPVEQGSHGTMTGTSMATPFIAGTVALLLQAQPGLKGHPADVAKLLYNTAKPIQKNTELGTAKPEGVFRQGSGLADVVGALAAKVTASPAVIKLGEGTSHTVTISLTNKTAGTLTYAVSRVSGVSAAASTSGGNEVGTTTPLYAWADAGFKASKTVTVKAGKTVKVKVKITAPASILKGKPGMLYGGWVTFTTTGAGNTVSVPFAGLRGDYQSIKLLNKFKYDDGSSAWKLPTLGYADSAGYLLPETGSGHVFTMVDIGNSYEVYDTPLVLYHLDYPASDVTAKITNTRTKKSHDVILDWTGYDGESSYRISKKSTHLNRQSRDASLQFIDVEGYYNKGEAWAIEDGTYTVTIKVLKPMGSSSKKSHWESFTTKSFRIEDES